MVEKMRVLEGVFAPLEGSTDHEGQEVGLFKIQIRYRERVPEGVRYYGMICNSISHPQSESLGVSFVYLPSVDLKVGGQVTIQGEVLDFVPPNRDFPVSTFILDVFWVTCWDLVLPAKRTS